MRRGDRKRITVDGKRLDATYLGRGKYCVAYRHGKRVYLFVDQDDNMKDAITSFGGCHGYHIPRLKYHEDAKRGNKWVKIFSSPYYRNVTAKDKKAWAIIKTLRKVEAEIREKFHRKVRLRNDEFRREGRRAKMAFFCYAHDYRQRVVNVLELREAVPQSVIDSLRKMSSAGGNWGDAMWDFSRTNFGVTQSGRLILRDVLVCAKKLYEERTRKW